MLASNFAFKLNVRRHHKATEKAAKGKGKSGSGVGGGGTGAGGAGGGGAGGGGAGADDESSGGGFPLVGRCRLTVSNPVLKAPTVSALQARG
jgi:hypothetical protein